VTPQFTSDLSEIERNAGFDLSIVQYFSVIATGEKRLFLIGPKYSQSSFLIQVALADTLN